MVGSDVGVASFEGEGEGGGCAPIGEGERSGLWRADVGKGDGRTVVVSKGDGVVEGVTVGTAAG